MFLQFSMEATAQSDIVRKEGLKQALAWRDARFEESLETKGKGK